MLFYIRLIMLAIIAFTLGCVSGAVQKVDQLSKAPVYKKTLTPEQIASDASTRVFRVIIESAAGKGGGTAFLLTGPNGKNVIVTNRHICESFERVADYGVLYLEQSDYRYYTKIVRQSATSDLCLLETPAELVATIDSYDLADRRPLKNEAVYSNGHPFLLPLTQVYGQVKNEFVLPADPRDSLGGILAMGLRFGVVPGCSGSPVVNVEGKVVGVIFAYMENGGLMIPLSSLKEFLNERN